MRKVNMELLHFTALWRRVASVLLEVVRELTAELKSFEG